MTKQRLPLPCSHPSPRLSASKHSRHRKPHGRNPHAPTRPLFVTELIRRLSSIDAELAGEMSPYPATSFWGKIPSVCGFGQFRQTGSVSITPKLGAMEGIHSPGRGNFLYVFPAASARDPARHVSSSGTWRTPTQKPPAKSQRDVSCTWPSRWSRPGNVQKPAVPV